MNLNNRSWILKLSVFLAVLIFISLYYFNKIDNSILFSLILASITLYLGMVRSKMEKDKMFKELITEFNSRYSGELNNVFNRIRNTEAYNLTEKEKLMVIDYFNLCAEEFLWYKADRIPSEVWRAWKNGILENLNLPQVCNIYQEETNIPQKAESFYGLVEELQKP